MKHPNGGHLLPVKAGQYHTFSLKNRFGVFGFFIFGIKVPSEDLRRFGVRCKILKIIQPDDLLCSLTYVLVFACLHQNIYLSHLKSKQKIELTELNELEYSKTPAQMSSYAH